MWKGRFSENTSEIVQHFTQSLDLDWDMAIYDIAGSIAHSRMLGEIGILDETEVDVIEKGLLQVKREIEEGDLLPSEEYEDVHMNIEKRLTELTGSTGARLHSGRSRNDQTATALRLYMRDKIVELGEGVISLLDSLLERAAYHNGTVVPGYTHLQQAQPINMGHYWMSVFVSFDRDAKLLLRALEACNESPLGAGALAGSTLPLDRKMTADMLGFKDITRNSLDSVASRDHLLDYHYFASRFMLHCSRLCEDLVIYSSQEFGWLILPDAFCTGSSMMPQKKNPDVPELIRGKFGQVAAGLFDLFFMLKGLPSTYNRDLQEDKRSLLASLRTLEGVMKVLVPLLQKVEVEKNRVFNGQYSSLCLATDIAEYLVIRGVPFREAHWKVGKLVKWCIDNERELSGLDFHDFEKFLPEAEEDILSLLSYDSAIERRKTAGGTSPESVRDQIDDGYAGVEELRKELEGFKFDLF